MDERVILFETFQGRKYCDSPKAIYETMLKRDTGNKFVYIWAIRKAVDRTEIKISENTHVVDYFSKEYYRNFARAKYIVTNSRILPHIRVKKKQTVIQTWHGTPLKRLGCDINVDHENPYNTLKEIYKQYEREAKNMNYLLSPSAYATEKLSSTFNLKKMRKEACVVEEGYPRNDFLYQYTNEEINRMKKRIGIPSDKKVILYAPTYRDNKHETGTGYTFLPDIDFDALADSLSNEYVLLFRAHYFVAKYFDFEKYQGFIYNVSEIQDINHLYILSDVLVTDYSSVFFDYANLKRPMIFYMYDLESYQKELRGFYLELDELPGPIVKKEAELIERLNNLAHVHDLYKEKIQRFSDRFNYLDDDSASQRVIDKVGFFK